MNVERVKKRWYSSDLYHCDFREMVDDAVGDGACVLDVGAGAGEVFSYDLKGRVKEMVGVDMDPRVESNPLLHRGIRCSVTSIPVEDKYFDVVFCRYVLEHITEPKAFLDEICRVLKPGGRFMFLAPNKWYYVAIISRLTPHWFHGWYNARLRGMSGDDIFPTVYLLNSAGSLRRQLKSVGFEEETLIQHETCPNYLCWSLPTFYMGLIYERIVNSTNLLAGLRVILLGVFVKKA